MPERRNVAAGFDHHAPTSRDESLAFWSDIRARDGLARSEQHGGFHLVARHADLCRAAADFRLFSSAEGVALPVEDRSRHIPEEVDPPLQRAYRAILDPFLSRDAMNTVAPIVHRHVEELVATLGGRARVEFVSDFARALPVKLSLEVFGFPVGDADRLFDLVDRLIQHRGMPEGRAAGAELTDYISVLLQRKAAAGPTEDVVSAIAHGAINGRPLDIDEKVSMARLLLFGGFTTVMLALAWAVYELALRPDLGDRLRSEPELMPTAVDEFVRKATPAAYLRRVATGAGALGGSDIHAGDQILLCFASANHDPAVFENPTIPVLDRRPNPHLAFGFGAHRCAGSQFAKLQLEIAIASLLQHFERFELDPERTPTWASGETQGFATLPIILHPRASL